MAFLFLLGLAGIMLYRHLKDYLLTEEQLHENNYPQPNPEKPSILVTPGMTKTRVNDRNYTDLNMTLSVRVPVFRYFPMDTRVAASVIKLQGKAWLPSI